jgi:hypothetical protein
MTMNHFLLHALLMSMLGAGPLHASAQTPGATAPAPKATVDDFRWIVGHWAGTGLGGTSEEIWMPPAGGALPGAFRQVQDGKVTFYELLAFVEREGTVVLRLKHFNPDLTGWEEKGQVLEFPLLELTPTKAVFNAMTFTHDTTDAFRVSLRLRDRKTGELKEEIFEYRRVRIIAP